MPILLSVTTGNSEGHKTRRCDSACYNAKGPVCECVCGGLNHGVGILQARKNTEALTRSALKKMNAKREDIYQIDLFAPKDQSGA